MSRKTYVGYDLGDGETITDLVISESELDKSKTKTDFDDMTMPNTRTSGRAMPTVFAFQEDGDVIFSETILAEPENVANIVTNFKRCPSDLMKENSLMTDAEQIEFIKKSSGWPGASAWADGNTPEMLSFKNSVVVFTNAIFTDDNYRNRLRSAAHDSEEIVFCVGHPTRWTELDVAIYELVLKNTILGKGEYEGKKSSIIMEKESRAAFLYSKDLEAYGKLPKGSSVLLIDVGSSTIDITAMTATSNNHQYNNGSNYLGARSIDFMIRNWYLKELQSKRPAEWSMYQSMIKDNPTIPNALTLACRVAKEQLYSTTNGKSVVNFALFPGIRLEVEEMDKMIETTPIADILKTDVNLNDEECAMMGNKSWKELFREFLTEEKSEMTTRGIEVGFIILTGSASRMPFVPQIVLEVFDEVSSDLLKYDMDPSRTISKGLALVGPSNEKSKAFQEDLNDLIDEKLEKIIEKDIPALGKEMGTVISDILTPRMKNRIKSWKNGDIKTLNDMNRIIKEDCSEDNLAELLTNSSEYTEVIEKWLKDEVGKDIAIELKELCDKYGVREIGIDDLNIMTIPKISIGNIPIDPLDFMDTIGAVVSLISGVIVGASLTTILGVVIGVVSLISQTLAGILFTALVSLGPAGLAVLAAVAGFAVAALVANKLGEVKEIFMKKINGYDLPSIARKTMTDGRIDSSFSSANLPKQIEDAFKDKKLKADVVKKVSTNLKGQVEKRAEDIKFAIESR